MASYQWNTADIETLAQLLEQEKVGHRRRLTLCFSLFCISVGALVLALCAIGVIFVISVSTEDRPQYVGLLSIIVSLACIVVTFFGAWSGVQDCLNSIERTLFAARHNRHQLFAHMLERVQCVDRKSPLWLELVQSFFGSN
jgi:hypothetical protein